MQGGVDVIISATEPAYGGPRLYAGLELGYSLRVAGRLLLCPAVEVNVIGGGFPQQGALVAKLGVGMEL